MNDKRYSDIPCPVCHRRVQGLIANMSKPEAGTLPYRPSGLKQRIWAKFRILAQWIRPRRKGR